MMSTVNISKRTTVEIEIDGMLYTEEEAHEIYEALRGHFEEVCAPSDNTTLKDILEKMEQDEKNQRKVKPYQPFPRWPDPIKPEDIGPHIDPFWPTYPRYPRYDEYNHTGTQPDPYAVETTMRFKLKT